MCLRCLATELYFTNFAILIFRCLNESLQAWATWFCDYISLCGKFLGSVLGIILEWNLDFIFYSGVLCSICRGGVSVQSIFAVSALWVLWPLLWILDVVMQHFSFCRMIISLDLAAGFFLLSCWRGVWEEVAGCVSGVMTFSWCRLTGGVNWQHTPAVASISTKLCLLLINLAGAIGKKQDLQEPGFGWGGTVLYV